MKTNWAILNLYGMELMTDNCKLITIFTAVASAGPFAAFLSFQRRAPYLPPTQNVNSAPSPLLPARQFSGKYAINAQIALTFAISATI